MRIVSGRALAPVAFLFSCAALPQLATAQVDFTGGYSQDFDTLANSGSSAALPAGWRVAAIHPLRVPGLSAERHLLEIVRTRA